MSQQELEERSLSREVMPPFSEDYARYYDLFYEGKPYEKECDYLEQVLTRFSEKSPKKLLELGCGTGGHALVLASRGYQVAAVDRSLAMLQRAREKMEKRRVSFELFQQSMAQLDLPYRADVAFSLFHAINYLSFPEELIAAFKRVRAHLKRGGLFLFDFRWGVPALLHFAPRRVKIVEREGERVVRISETEVDRFHQIYTTVYTCRVYEKEREKKEFQEEHKVSFFFLKELEQYLKAAGFELLQIFPYLSLAPFSGEVLSNWTLLAVAKKRREVK